MIDLRLVRTVLTLWALLGLIGGSVGAQTLGDLADAQRVKQQAEIAKLRREAAQAEIELSIPLRTPEPPALSPEDARRMAQKAAAAALPRIVVHALYSKNGAWIAELAEGQRLRLAMVGMQLNGQRVVGVDQGGLQLAKPCTAHEVREKIRCGLRVVAVGEAV
jgi:hypothetical protein